MKNWKIVVGVLIFSACQNAPKPPLSDEKMVDVLVDLNTAEALVESEKMTVKDSLTKIYYAQIFEKQRVTRRDFDSSMVILSQNPERLDSIYAAVLRKINPK